MTPQEQFEYKLKWMPGTAVPLHSDVVDRGKDWCRRHAERHQWSMSEWTDVYEHTFHFENEEVAHLFRAEFGLYAR